MLTKSAANFQQAGKNPFPHSPFLFARLLDLREGEINGKMDTYMKNQQGFSPAIIFIVIMIAIFVVAGFVSAATNIFIDQTNGPSAGAIKHGMAFSFQNPEVIYADRYKSTDGGESWEKFDLPSGDAVRAIAVDPQNAEIVYLAANNTIFKSTNGASSWNKRISIDPRGDNPAVSVIAVSTTDSDVVYAGTTHGDFYVSKDGGGSWQNISSALGVSSPISRVAFNRQNSSEVYVSTGSWYLSALVGKPRIGHGLFKSEDSGKTFKKLANEFSSDLVQDVDVSGEIVYASVHHAPDSPQERRRIYKSTNGGASWQAVLEKRIVTHIALNPQNPDHVVVSGGDDEPFYVSRDGGGTWKTVRLDKSESINYTHELEMIDGSRVYAMEYYKPFMKSSDGGNAWRWSSEGIKDSSVYSLEVHPENRNKVLAGTGDGALHSTFDGGKTWRRFFGGALEGGNIAAIAFNPDDSKNLYFGVVGAADRKTGRYYGAPWRDTGLYVSESGGQNWKKLKNLPHPHGEHDNHQLEVYDIFIHPQNSRLMLLGTASEGVYRSEDGGKTWQEANNGIPQEGFYWNLNLRPEGNTPRARCDGEYGKHQKGENFDTGCFYYASRTSMNISVNPHNPSEIWYTTLNGVFVSRDFGKNWSWLSDDLKGVHVHFMAFDPEEPEIIYLGTHQGAIGDGGKRIDSSKGLLISRDGGKSWHGVSGGPGVGHDIRAIAVNPEDPNVVIVGTEDPLYTSKDKGRTWGHLAVSGLTEADEIRISTDAKVVYFATAAAGVWKGLLDSSLPFYENVSEEPISGEESNKITQTLKKIFGGDEQGQNISESVEENSEPSEQEDKKDTVGEETGGSYFQKFFWLIFWIIFAVIFLLLARKMGPKIYRTIISKSK